MIKFKHSRCLSLAAMAQNVLEALALAYVASVSFLALQGKKKMLNLVLLRNYGHSIPPPRFSTVRKLVPNSLKNMLNTNSFFFYIISYT